MYSVSQPLSAGGMNTRSTSRTDPYGNDLPDTSHVRMGGSLTRVPSPQEADLLKQRAGMDFINNAQANTGILAPTTPAATPSGGDSRSTLASLMALLTGGQFGGSSSQQVTSGDTSIQENKGDTLGSLTGFINNLLATAMGGKASSDKNATELASGLMGHNANAALANQASQERGKRMDWVGQSFGNLRPGFRAAAVPGASSVDTSLFSQGVPTEQIFGGGLGGADPLGILGIKDDEPSAQTTRPPVPQRPWGGTNQLMRQGGVRPFQVPQFAGLE